MSRALIIALFVLGTVATGCSSTTEPSAQAQLVGSWTLVNACGGITGGCRPPEMVNEPSRYQFRQDDSVEAYRGTQHLFTVKFTIAPGPADKGADTRPSLLIGLGPAVDPRPLRMEFIGSDTLVLDEGCCDRFAFKYARAR